MPCKKDHSYLSYIMNKLPADQGGKGRHKCAACAYEKGLKAGYKLKEKIDLGAVLDSLDESQAGCQRHKSPRAAFALGYYEGVLLRINDDSK